MPNNGIFDTHCHLMSELYDEDIIVSLLKNAVLVGVDSICNVGCDLETSKLAVNQIYQYDNDKGIPNLYAAVGVHPNEVDKCNDKTISELKSLIQTGKVIGIGEIGLDYYRKTTKPDLQKKWFIEQLRLAKEHKLPVLLHIRDAFDDAYKIIVEENITHGLLHCFTGTKEVADKFIKQGFFISFAGNITYKNAVNLEEVVKIIPLNRILVETDAPYLTPVADSFHEKQPSKRKFVINNPENIILTVRKIAKIKNIPVDNIKKITNENAISVFNLKNRD